MNQKIGRFNCQGILISAAKQQMLVNDFELYTFLVRRVQTFCTAQSRLSAFVVLLQMCKCLDSSTFQSSDSFFYLFILRR